MLPDRETKIARTRSDGADSKARPSPLSAAAALRFCTGVLSLLAGQFFGYCVGEVKAKPVVKLRSFKSTCQNLVKITLLCRLP